MAVSVDTIWTYVINISGCDDSTYVELELDAHAASVVERLAAATHAESTYGCQPTMTITPKATT